MTKKPFILTPHARITFHAFFDHLNAENKAVFLYNGLSLSFPLIGNAKEQIQTAQKDTPYLLILWFRTHKGIIKDPQLSSLFPAPNLKVRKNKKLPAPLFVVGGKLIKINENLLTLKIEASGHLLQKDFKVELSADNELIEKPSTKVKPGRTFIITGICDIDKGTLQATKITAKRLETRENPTIPE